MSLKFTLDFRQRWKLGDADVLIRKVEPIWFGIDLLVQNIRILTHSFQVSDMFGPLLVKKLVVYCGLLTHEPFLNN